MLYLEGFNDSKAMGPPYDWRGPRARCRKAGDGSRSRWCPAEASFKDSCYCNFNSIQQI